VTLVAVLWIIAVGPLLSTLPHWSTGFLASPSLQIQEEKFRKFESLVQDTDRKACAETGETWYAAGLLLSLGEVE
jgi:hypothetical protein